MNEDGVIKFQCHWIEEPHHIEVPQALMQLRDKMHALGLIGVYESDGIGYGNISMKVAEGMLISGTQTGHLPRLSADQYALVTEYDIAANSLHCLGRVKASAESLTHLAFYEADPTIQGVIHIHNLDLWERLMHQVPTSNASVPYGTPEMAEEITRLFKESTMPQDKLMVMGGHREGLIAFGADLAEAAAKISAVLQKNMP